MSKTTRQILHEFGTTYRVLTADERKEDLDKVEAAIDAKFRESLPERKQPLSKHYLSAQLEKGFNLAIDQALARWEKGEDANE